MHVAVLGASLNPERFSFKAMNSLLENGHRVTAISPGVIDFKDVFSVRDLKYCPLPLDVLTIYVNPKVSTELTKTILQIKPRIVIFNPGTENEKLKSILEGQKIKTLEACTLILLSTHQFNENLEYENL